MEISRSYLLFLLVVTISVSSVKTSYRDHTFVGQEELKNYFVHLPSSRYFSRVSLSCSSSTRLHIAFLEFPNRGYSCDNNVATLQSCEGRPGTCDINLRTYSYRCSAASQVNVTFQCIPSGRIQPMLVESRSTSTYSQLTYFATPRFTDRFGNYSADTNCQCTFYPISRSSFTIKLLYADLESGHDQSCIDYISFNKTEKYCSVNSQDNPVMKTYSGNTTVSFRSDDSIQRRGGWFSVYPGSQGGSVRVVCGQAATFRGTAELASYGHCYENDYMRKLKLQCGSSEVIHITHIKLSKSSSADCSSQGTICTWHSTIPLDSCEGIKGSCTVDVATQTPSSCNNINMINVTFQCIPNSRVMSMCPSTSVTTLVSVQPTYFTTPRFTSNGGRYSYSTNCLCTVHVTRSSVTVKLLYAKLGTGAPTSTSCFDYVSFSTSGNLERQYCDERSLNITRSKTFSTSSYSYEGFKFVSDYSNGGRGAWFSVYSDSTSSSATVTCANDRYRTTTSYYRSYRYRATTLNWWDRRTTSSYRTYRSSRTNYPRGSTTDVGGIIGGVVGGLVFIIFIVALRSCRSQRTVNRQATNRQQRMQRRIFFIRQTTTTVPSGAASAANASSDAPPPFSSVGGISAESSLAEGGVREGNSQPPSYDEAIRSYPRTNGPV